MTPELELNVIAGKIVRAANEKGRDLSEYTLWADHPTGIIYCGTFATHTHAAACAAEHTSIEQGRLYIAKGPLSNFAIYQV